jgi:hypothetical protein
MNGMMRPLLNDNNVFCATTTGGVPAMTFHSGRLQSARLAHLRLPVKAKLKFSDGKVSYLTFPRDEMHGENDQRYNADRPEPTKAFGTEPQSERERLDRQRRDDGRDTIYESGDVSFIGRIDRLDYLAVSPLPSIRHR